jgi:succinate dehydrogenase / fumarate reductase cytochrome b subunit
MMAAAGLFLISFLLVHMGINLLLVIFEDSRPFNLAAHFMGTNILIKVFEIILFGGFILHILYGFIIQTINWLSRPVGYKIANNQQTSYFSKFMIHTAVIIFIFMIIHLFDFYFKAKIFGEVPGVIYDGKEYHDLGSLVLAKFKILWVVIFYIASFIFLGFHLLHGFQSAFQTLGLEHKSYTPLIRKTGIILTAIIITGFTAIPVIIYFTR